MIISSATKKKIESKIPLSVREVLKNSNLSYLDIYRIVKEEIDLQPLTKDDLGEVYLEVEKLINSYKPKRYSKYFNAIKLHREEFIRLLAKGTIEKEFSYDSLIRELELFWTKDYSLVNIFQGLGFKHKDVLLKFIGIENDGIIPLTREMKYIAEILKWIKEDKVKQLTDIEDCYYWCQASFSGANKSLQIVTNWLSKFLDTAERVDGRLVVLKSSELGSTGLTEDDLFFLK